MHHHYSSETQIHPFGYSELKNKPNDIDLKYYYEERYYQSSVRTHRTSYSEEELRYRENKCTQKRLLIEKIWSENMPSRPSLLGVGAGEGFLLDHFYRAGYTVKGIDYSSHGCSTHHPHLLDKLDCGDVEEGITRLMELNERFDVIILDNVLEHLLNPSGILNQIRSLINSNGLLIIEVPNDFSIVQNYLLDKKRIKDKFWVASPDHISYFNLDGLNNLLDHHGFDSKETLADFPIDLFLFNERTNYVNDPQVGKSCHQARIEFENLIHAQNPQATLEMYATMAKLGIGRQIMGVYQLRKDTMCSFDTEAV